MDMPPVESARPIEVAAIAAVVFFLMAMLGRLFARTFSIARRFMGRYVPERISRAIALVVAALLFFSVADGVLFRAFMRISDNSFAALDALIEPEYAAPTDPLVTGSPASLVSWEELGRAGRQFIASGPTADDISAFTGRPAQRPVRVYVGLNSADDIEDRARLAPRRDDPHRRLRPQGPRRARRRPAPAGWTRPRWTRSSTCTTATPPSSAVQYSYLTSSISLLVEPGYGSDAARAMFRSVYATGPALPKDSRPRLYLHGLSLGAHGSNQSFQLDEVIGDPFNGAVWSGPPFSTQRWRRRHRRPQRRLARVAADLRRRLDHPLHQPGEPPRPARARSGGRCASSTCSTRATRSPSSPRRALAQARLDERAASVPTSRPSCAGIRSSPSSSSASTWRSAWRCRSGHGHDYAPEHYIDAWTAVTAPEGWSAADIDRLKAHFAL